MITYFIIIFDSWREDAKLDPSVIAIDTSDHSFSTQVQHTFNNRRKTLLWILKKNTNKFAWILILKNNREFMRHLTLSTMPPVLFPKKYMVLFPWNRWGGTARSIKAITVKHLHPDWYSNLASVAARSCIESIMY